MDLYTPPSVAYGGAYTIRPYDRVRARVQKMSRFRTLRGRLWGVCDTPLRPGMCGPSKNCPVFVPFGAVCGAYAIRPYGWVRAALQKTVSFSSPSGPLSGRIRYAPTIGYVRSFEIPMRSLDRARARVQKTDLYSPPSVTSGGRIQYALTTGHVRGFKKWICIRHRRWRMAGRMQYAPTTGYVRPFKKLSRFRPLRGRLWGVCDTPLRLGTCDASKY